MAPVEVVYRQRLSTLRSRMSWGSTLSMFDRWRLRLSCWRKITVIYGLIYLYCFIVVACEILGAVIIPPNEQAPCKRLTPYDEMSLVGIVSDVSFRSFSSIACLLSLDCVHLHLDPSQEHASALIVCPGCHIDQNPSVVSNSRHHLHPHLPRN